MEFEKDASNPLFPDCNTSFAKFFNTDNNCTTGFMKMGDLETGSLVTLNFKTMPYSANQFMFSDPFLVYSLTAEIISKGKTETIEVISPEEVLKTKRPFIPLF